MTQTARLSLAGFLATAVAFGPARMGFGLFLPTFRDTFAIGTAEAGLIASGGFASFLAALPLAAFLSTRMGQRVPVVAGASLAVAGFVAIALTAHPAVLALGVALAGTSAGLCWAPFNDATERVVMPADRDGVLSCIAAGTSLGVALAGALALMVTAGLTGWRLSWGAFAALATAAAGAALAGCPGAPPERRGEPAPLTGLIAYRRAAWPLYAAALTFGATNAVYLSFAGDRVVQAGGMAGVPERAASAAIFVAYGLCGLAGLATGRFERWLGLRWLLRVIFATGAVSLVAVALAPRSAVAVLASAGAHGAALMVISAVFSFWSLRLFPGRGTAGFIGALTCVAGGSVLGPTAAGTIAAHHGATAMFLACALPAACLAAVPLAPRRSGQ